MRRLTRRRSRSRPGAALVAVAVIVAAALATLPSVHAGAVPGVLVMPVRPGVDVGPAERAVAAASGVALVPFSAVAPALEAAAHEVRDDETRRLGEVGVVLDGAREAYLAQRFAAMAASLERARDAALPVLGRPEHAATLWELCFQLGLARHALGDDAGARQAFLLALELDPARRPARELYGPGVAEAFALADAERARRASRPVTLALAPAGAWLWIDGVAVLDPARPRLLREGPHVLLALAPGHRPLAQVVELGAGQGELPVSLEPLAGVAPAAALAPHWWHDELAVTRPPVVAALLALAAAHGAVAVLLVDGERAWLVTRDGATPAQASPTAALARLGPSGGLRATSAPSAPAPPSRSAWRSPWLWTGVGAAVITAVVLGIVWLDDEAPPARTEGVFR